MTDKKENWFARHKVLTVVVGVILLFIVFGSMGDTPDTSEPAAKAEDTKTEKAEEKKSSTPVEYVSALAQATAYANEMHMSKEDVYDQLVSEYGGKFKPEAAKYAMKHVKADWKENALAQAKTYQSEMNMSPAAVRDQLVSEHGGKFTEAEADYAMAHLNK